MDRIDSNLTSNSIFTTTTWNDQNILDAYFMRDQLNNLSTIALEGKVGNPDVYKLNAE